MRRAEEHHAKQPYPAPTGAPLEALLVTVTNGSDASLAHLRPQLEKLAEQDCRVNLLLVVRGDASIELDGANVSIHVLRVPAASSLSHSRNVALRYARDTALLQRCQLVGFPDDDSLYPRGVLTAAFALMTQHGVDVVSGPFGPSRDEINEKRFPSRRFNLTPRLVPWLCCSASTFLTASTVNEVGLFDERLGLGARFGSSEDTDYVVRALNAGRRGLYAPDVVFSHHAYKLERTAQYYEGNVAMLAKHALRHPRLAVSLGYRLVVGVAYLIRGKLAVAHYFRAVRAGAVMLTGVHSSPREGW